MSFICMRTPPPQKKSYFRINGLAQLILALKQILEHLRKGLLFFCVTFISLFLLGERSKAVEFFWMTLISSWVTFGN